MGTVRSVEVGGTSATVARAGDAADVTLSGVEASAVAAGSVVCAAGWAVPNVAQFEARVLVLVSAGPLLCGQQVIDLVLKLMAAVYMQWHMYCRNAGKYLCPWRSEKGCPPQPSC